MQLSRAAMALGHASRARAYNSGRAYVIPEDLVARAEAVVLHRVRLTYEGGSRRGRKASDVLASILKSP